jgi:Mn2+/Fe2+ NRAMP family transporter
MKAGKWFEIALGVVTSIGGFLEVGSIATAAQAGAKFGAQLIWPIVLGTICLIFLIEMAGRLAAVSHHPLPSAVRERFGWNFAIIPLLAATIVDYLVLSSEIGGCCIAIQLLTGISRRWWALPVALIAWGLLWKGTFGVIEYGVSTLGLITVVFIVAAFKSHPPVHDVLHGLIPTLAHHSRANYWFLVVSILGATISPYLFNFYSSGAVEDEWGQENLAPNRVIATLGMSFGGVISVAVLVAAAGVLMPRGIPVNQYEQIANVTAIPLGKWGFYLFAAGLFIACLGASLELSLDSAYVYAQTFGWNWGENQKPRDAARFASVYTVMILLASLPTLLGADPMKLTMFSMAVTALVLPLVVLPFLVLMNDDRYVKDHRNGRIGNFIVFFVIVMASIVALVAIPLEIFGGS